jgi:hypothetical protein
MRSIVGRIERAGAFIDVTAMAPGKHVELLRKLGRPVPSPMTLRTLVDTGASDCALDFGVINHFGLMPTGRVKIHTSSTGPEYEERDQYGMSLYIGSQPGETAEYTVSVIGAGLASEGFLAIIGWSVLERCVLLCNGPNKTFQLDY